jgi:dTDP-L-rhamnose 4-epimerase
MKVLLTGGAGFVGRAAHDQLAAAGHEIRVFDRILDRRNDITDHDRLATAASGCDTVVHLAAKVGLGANICDIHEYALHNDYGTAMALRVAAEAGVSRFMYASSVVVYGEGRYRCAAHGILSPPPRRRDDLDGGASTRYARLAVMICIPNWWRSRRPSILATPMRRQRRTGSNWRRSGVGRPEGTVVALRFHNVYGPGMPPRHPVRRSGVGFHRQFAARTASARIRGRLPARNFIHVSMWQRRCLRRCTTGSP